LSIIDKMGVMLGKVNAGGGIPVTVYRLVQTVYRLVLMHLPKQSLVAYGILASPGFH